MSSELIERIRRGDQMATAELVRLYEPQIRRAVRVRLAHPNMRRIIDSTDICQSVMAKFFQKVTSGQYAFAEPDDLYRLLVKMVRNKLVDWIRREQAVRRRMPQGSLQEVAPSSLRDQREFEPSRILSAREDLANLYADLSEQDRRVAQSRAEGMSWAEIARLEDKQPDAVRIRFFRALAKTSVRIDYRTG